MARVPVAPQDQRDEKFTDRPRPDSAEIAERAFLRAGIAVLSHECSDACSCLVEAYRAANFDPRGPYGNRWN